MDAEINYLESVDYTINSEESAYHAAPINNQCFKEISKRFKVPTIILRTFLHVENGYSGHIRYNEVNHSWDVGEMQINSANWKEIYDHYGITPVQIRFNGCSNLLAGAHLIRKRLDEHGKSKINDFDSLFGALARYHSKTPHFNNEYKLQLLTSFNKILVESNHGK